MLRKLTLFGLVLGLSLSIFVNMPGTEVNGSEDMKMAIVLVSDWNGYDQDEVDKATDFYDHLISEGNGHCEVIFLAPDGTERSDGGPTRSNLVSAFELVANDTNSNKDVVIWISDHQGAIIESYLQLDGGKLYSSDMDTWMDDMVYEDLTLILGGERSGLAGSDLCQNGRTIMSSMGPNQEVDDGFDIARSLSDPSADSDGDGEVSYKEAFNNEKSYLTDQDPQIWEN